MTQGQMLNDVLREQLLTPSQTYLYDLDIIVGEREVSMAPLGCGAHRLTKVMFYVQGQLFNNYTGLEKGRTTIKSSSLKYTGTMPEVPSFFLYFLGNDHQHKDFNTFVCSHCNNQT